MQVLVVGGSGYVGSIVLPLVARQHTLRIFDLHQPSNPEWDYVAGSVDDLETLDRAALGMDVLLYMAMGAKAFETTAAITTNFDVNVKGV